MEREDFIFLEALNRHGTVFLVRQNSTGRILVARKAAAEQTGVFETLRTIGSGHIPAIRAIEPQPDGTVLVYEDYIQGVTLRKVLDDRQPHLEKSDAVEIARQLCRALAPVHAAGIVHRDIKPENIILGVDSQVYLIDFGIARVEKAGRSADTEFLGTQGYAAPEQFGFCQSDARADIYALGDCAEINGQVLPFLQPIQLSAMVLAKNLLGNNTPLKLPAMLVKIKTPELPLHLAGETQRQDLRWQINTERQGMVARGVDDADQLRAFVVSEDRMKEAFGLLKTLPM